MEFKPLWSCPKVSSNGSHADGLLSKLNDYSKSSPIDLHLDGLAILSISQPFQSDIGSESESIEQTLDVNSM